MRSNKALRQAIAVACKGTVRPIPSCRQAWLGIPLHSRLAEGQAEGDLEEPYQPHARLRRLHAQWPGHRDPDPHPVGEHGRLSVQLKPGATDADLNLVDRKAWTATALAWLQPYLDAPLPTAASTVRTIETEFRATTDSGRRSAAGRAAEAGGRGSDRAADQPVRRACLPTARGGDEQLLRPWHAAWFFGISNG